MVSDWFFWGQPDFAGVNEPGPVNSAGFKLIDPYPVPVF